MDDEKTNKQMANNLTTFEINNTACNEREKKKGDKENVDWVSFNSIDLNK